MEAKMQNIKKLMGLLILFQFSFIKAQDEPYVFVYPKADKIDPILECKIFMKENVLTFNYNLVSLGNSEQNIWTLRITYKDNSVSGYEAPEGWLVRKPNNKKFISWGADDIENFIPPGISLNDFKILSNGLPSISKYYIQGYVPTPVLDQEPDVIVGGRFYENSKQGKTLGPKDPPDPFIHTDFLDTLISYTQQSFDLKWITSQSTSDKYEDYFNTAQTHLLQEDTSSARSTLKMFLQNVAQDSGTVLTGEAYALLRYNTKCLLVKTSGNTGIRSPRQTHRQPKPAPSRRNIKIL